ncbi:MAG: Asp-tRNA(Asn)/Glu-tRNA(Gln) amidotransferase subunit GatB, partial [Planctomycetota bacterium]|nr:Asp-tRNA(Asn)/Glu-tRNA(Gln) amidotransferase subunit GatB [Planctomycetota bacterium]
MMKDVEPVIGLEVHLQLKTNTKLFCGCPVSFAASPNTLACPVCLGLPGSLPVVNQRAVELSLKLALALKCNVNRLSSFDRKNYFYPDLPKGYQITQHYTPIASDGFIEINSSGNRTKKVRVLRLHLEEDAGKIIYAEKTGYVLVDFNRCGVPLVELVSATDISSPQEAYDYLVEVRRIARYLEISDADMEKGQLRCDVNISLRPKGGSSFGTRTEIKNLNSFAAVRDALEAEIERQKEILFSGGRIEQETLYYDAESGKLFVQRSKEESHDYRYFPEPDLPPLFVSDEMLKKASFEVVELPMERERRLMKQYGLPPQKVAVLCSRKALADYFEECVKEPSPQLLADWLITETLRVVN